MSLKRFAALIVTLVVFGPQSRVLADEGAKPTANSITGVTVKQESAGSWVLEFDYAYTGTPPGAGFEVGPPLQAGANTALQITRPRLFSLLPGSEHVSTHIFHPGEGTTTQVTVSLRAPGPDGPVLATQTIDQVIEWGNPDEVAFGTAFDLIENGRADALREARMTLERLIAKNPQCDRCYVELARIAMKTNWGPEGLHQAETLLDSALRIRSDSVNAKILLGYVYAHQRRFGEAQALFVEAARSDPPNNWLWTNWGELLEMRGNADEAIAKYREAITRPLGSYKYSSARESAYTYLLRLLEKREDYDGMEALYRQRIAEFGPGSCYSAGYARFKLNVRRDAQGAIDLARGALNLDCEDTPSRQILGLASYVKWAQSDGDAGAKALNEARIFLPAGATTLYLLVSNDSTMPAVKKLVAAGEAIDQKDNEEMTALAHALEQGDLNAAERLLKLGARPETPVGAEGLPVAFLPVLEGSVDAVRVMQRAGVDYSKLSYRGVTALDLAKRLGDDTLLKALSPKGGRSL